MGLLRSNKTEARKLSSDLREDDSGSVRRRRAVVGLSLLGSASLGVIALYQMGIIKHLPEPKLPYLDADKVDASPEAYEWLSTPDAILGVAGYGTTMVLAAMGGKDRVKKQPYIPLALAAKRSSTSSMLAGSRESNGPSIGHSASGVSLLPRPRSLPFRSFCPKRLKQYAISDQAQVKAPRKAA